MATETKAQLEIPKARRVAGDLAFAVTALVLSALLLSLLGRETQWIDGAGLAAQPSFWPALSLGGMTLFGLLYLLGSLPGRHEREIAAGEELGTWLRSLEFAAWFMAYVFVTPAIGYLAATIFFCVLLALRMGYRRPATLLAAAALGLGIVVLFKTLLQVKIPGGAVYDLLPDAARNLMITNF
jgi:hypothetical protein